MTFAFDDCELDLDRCELRREGVVRHVEPQVFDLLVELVKNRDRLVTREELLDVVWGHRFVSDATLSSRIKALRQAVGDDGSSQRIVRTVRGRGFRFAAEVTVTGKDRPSADQIQAPERSREEAGEDRAPRDSLGGTAQAGSSRGAGALPFPMGEFSVPAAGEPVEDDQQRIRFCRAHDGVRIAYATSGMGPPLVKTANWLSHLEYDWASPVWRPWLDALSRDHTLVRYDERGCGLSDWTAEDLSFDAWVRDLETVVDAMGLERFPLLGISQGGPVAIAYAVRHPERVSRLILYGSYAKGRRKRPDLEERDQAEVFLKMLPLGWGRDNPAFRQFFAHLFLPQGTPEQLAWFGELQRRSASAENAQRLMSEFYDIDVADLARQVRVPTLVLHASADAAVPFEAGRTVAGLIPDAMFVPLWGQNHILLESEPAWPRFVAEVRRFLGTEVEGEAALSTRS